MKVIDIIVHCYAGELPQYAAFLAYQLGSLSLHPPQDCRVRYMLGYTGDDTNTAEMLERARGWLPANVSILPCLMERGRLFRRSILRHEIAKATDADIVWFADVDYVFGHGCLDSVAAQVGPDSGLCYPREYLIHKDHATGDRAWQAALNCTKPPMVDVSEFTPKRSRVALGGLQIIGGVKANEIGYLTLDHLSRPTDGIKPFPCFKDDSKWRRVNFGGGLEREIEVPSLLRLRHSAGSIA